MSPTSCRPVDDGERLFLKNSTVFESEWVRPHGVSGRATDRELGTRARLAALQQHYFGHIIIGSLDAHIAGRGRRGAQATDVRHQRPLSSAPNKADRYFTLPTWGELGRLHNHFLSYLHTHLGTQATSCATPCARATSRQGSVSNHSFDGEFRSCLRLLEAVSGFGQYRECSGEPRHLCSIF